jgi:hypothetical protein
MSFRRLLGCFKALLAGVLCVTALARAEQPTEPDDVPLTPRQQALVDRLTRFTSDRAKSSDLRVRIIYSMTGEPEVERRPDNGFYAKARISAADLYEQALGSTDPLVLDLLLQRCQAQTRAQNRCDRIALARRWTEADTQNQVAWLALANVLKYSGDLDGSRAAFLRASRAPQWHEHYNDIARLLARDVPADLSLLEKAASLVEALSRAGWGIPFDAIQSLSAYCKEANDLRDACRRIVHTMVRDTDILFTLGMAAPFAARAQMDSSVVAAYRQKSDASQWSNHLEAPTGDPFAELDDRQAQETIERLQSMIDVGEKHRAEQIMLRQHVTESEAAARFVAALSPEQVAHRAELLRQARASAVANADSTHSITASP